MVGMYIDHIGVASNVALSSKLALTAGDDREGTGLIEKPLPATPFDHRV